MRRALGQRHSGHVHDDREGVERDDGADGWRVEDGRGQGDRVQTFQTPEWVTPASAASAVKISFSRK